MDSRHKKNVVLTYILAIVLMFVLFYGIAFHAAAVDVIASSVEIDGTVLTNFSMVIVSFVVIFIYWLIFKRRKFKGVLSFRNCSKEVFIGLAIVIVVDIICIIIYGCFLDGGIKSLVPPTLTTFSISLAAGVYEETAFRAIPISIFMKNQPSTRRIYLAVLITSLGFSLAHIMNLSIGASVPMTIIQVCGCFITGIFLSAVFLRTGSILLPMFFHFFHDIINLMDPMQSTGVLLRETITASTIVVEVVLSLCELLIGLYLLRKSTHNEIKNRWADIWHEDI